MHIDACNYIVSDPYCLLYYDTICSSHLLPSRKKEKFPELCETSQTILFTWGCRMGEIVKSRILTEAIFQFHLGGGFESHWLLVPASFFFA